MLSILSEIKCQQFMMYLIFDTDFHITQDSLGYARLISNPKIFIVSSKSRQISESKLKRTNMG